LRKSYSPISIYEYAAWVLVAKLDCATRYSVAGQKDQFRRGRPALDPYPVAAQADRTPHSAASLMMVAAF
jgi:hypothetical protein